MPRGPFSFIYSTAKKSSCLFIEDEIISGVRCMTATTISFPSRTFNMEGSGTLRIPPRDTFGSGGLEVRGIVDEAAVRMRETKYVKRAETVGKSKSLSPKLRRVKCFKVPDRQRRKVKITKSKIAASEIFLSLRSSNLR